MLQFLQLVKDIQFNTMNTQSILLYYGVRGKAQVVRSLLCYLQIDFLDMHLDRIEAGIEKIDHQVSLKLVKNPIDKQRLPLLVSGEDYIYGAYAISLYLCRKYDRLDLFGKSQNQLQYGYNLEAELKSTLQILLKNQMKCKTFLLGLAEQCCGKSQKQIRQLINLTYENVMAHSGYIKQICLILEKYGNEGFILGRLTIIDFYFLETCFYILGFFGNVDKSPNQFYEEFYHSLTANQQEAKISNKNYLSLMRKYVQRMKNQNFYKRNKKYLESYSLIFCKMSEQKIQGMKTIWVGESKYMK